jgi:hypothetical protein
VTLSFDVVFRGAVTPLLGCVSSQVTNWMYALAFMVFVMWLIMPLFYFPSIVDPNTSTAGQFNYFERLIVNRAQMILVKNNVELDGVNFQILVPQVFCVALQVCLPVDESRA